MPWSRVMGLRSIYAKTVRDSRRAALVVGGLGGLFMLATAAPYGLEFGTNDSRRASVFLVEERPFKGAGKERVEGQRWQRARRRTEARDRTA